MAQEPLSDDQCLRVMQAVAENGSKAAAARALGIPETTLRSRAHWIIGDPQADTDANFLTAFKCPRQAEAMMNGLQNLRAI